MPIVYVHGVATRVTTPLPTLTRLMTRYLAETITGTSDVVIEYAYWGDVAARFAWDGASRPRTPLRGQGGVDHANELERAIVATELSKVLSGLPTHPPESALRSGDLAGVSWLF
jgi:hypothetical protein